METPLADCQAFLRERFHSTTLSPMLADKGPMTEQGTDREDEVQDDPSCITCDKLCHTRFGGVCEKSKRRMLSSKLPEVFGRALIDHHLKVGHLLLLKTEADDFLGFLGVCMKRPRLHILIEATADPVTNEVQLVDPRLFWTSHQLFERMVVDEQSKCVTVEVFKYALVLENDVLKICLGASVNTFKLDPSTKVHVRKKQLRLPFGLKSKREPKRRAKRAAKPTKKKGNRKQKQNAPVAVESEQPLGSKSPGPLPSSSSTNSTSSSSSSSSRSDTESGGEVEEPLPFSDDVVKEEKRARAIVERHDALVAAQVNLQATQPDQPDQPGSLPSSSSTGPSAVRSHAESKQLASQQMPKAQASTAVKGKFGKTFFSKDLGVSDISHAASARSTCFFCGGRIQKGSVRFCWYHSTVKPSVWVHAMCLQHLIARDGYLAHSRKQMNALQRVGNLEPSLQEALAGALAALPKQ